MRIYRITGLMKASAFLALSAVLVGCASSPKPEVSATPINPPPVGPTPTAPAPPTQDYLVYVVAESADQVHLVRFGPGGARLEKSQRVGMMPTEINGPHGIAVSPDKKHYYVSIAHGTPYGTLWKFTTAGDTLKGRVTLGLFPATISVSNDGALAFVVNFNLHGDMVPSSVSIVSTDEMLEIARTTTCTMPHGSRINPQGTHQYSACMMDDMLVEINTQTFEISRHFMLAAGKEHGMAGPPAAMKAADAGGAHSGMSHDSAAMKASAVQCSPTWAQPSADGQKIYVACNKSNEIVEIDFKGWTVARRFPVQNGVYNLAVSPDGKFLIATNKRSQSVSIFDAASAKEIAKIATKRRVVHGAIVSPDSRYAFITVEGQGSEPGTLEVIDLTALKTIASVDLGQQAAGIDFYKMVPPGGQ
ncbi:MAG TPA: YncE family protein [Gemmatimonadaceae bacterium]|nr:YncE family protein [Gemmatimonadaceae bacterium]